MNTKRAAKGVVSLSASKRKPQAAQANAYDKLPKDATEAEIRDAAVTEGLAELEDRVADVRDSWETESLFDDVFDELTADTTSSLDGKSSIFLLISTLFYSPLRCHLTVHDIRRNSPHFLFASKY